MYHYFLLLIFSILRTYPLFRIEKLCLYRSLTRSFKFAIVGLILYLCCSTC
ncbi:hypothetical protein ZEAMMB73_Zm00001d048646 [Zea mays]|uniref:Uncharacterized protein n=1 Tax=Zea mays TaxID=4577 RepID=A0A1D6PN87_MAIZE|nr:hypothetical protein ZEAMMB73_Zm00001d048646 [Zea mays]